jgi:hypothetical protein
MERELQPRRRITRNEDMHRPLILHANPTRQQWRVLATGFCKEDAVRNPDNAIDSARFTHTVLTGDILFKINKLYEACIRYNINYVSYGHYVGHCQLLRMYSIYIATSMSDHVQTWFGFVNGFIVHTHVSELQEITAPPLISTIHKSPQNLLSLFQPVSSSAVTWQWFLTVQILQLHALKSTLHRLS